MECCVGEEYLAFIASSKRGTDALSNRTSSCKAASALRPQLLQHHSSLVSQELLETAITLLTQLMEQLTKEAATDGGATPGGGANNTAALLSFTTAIILCASAVGREAAKAGTAVPPAWSLAQLATGPSPLAPIPITKPSQNLLNKGDVQSKGRILKRIWRELGGGE